jgi:hypothetical protein
VPTSPVYLVKRGQPAEAARAIARLHGLTDESIVRARLAVVQHTVAMEQQSIAAIGAASLKDLFRTKVDRRRTLLTLGVWVCFNMAGAAFLGSGLYFLQQQVSADNGMCKAQGWTADNANDLRVSTSSLLPRSPSVCSPSAVLPTSWSGTAFSDSEDGSALYTASE